MYPTISFSMSITVIGKNEDNTDADRSHTMIQWQKWLKQSTPVATSSQQRLTNNNVDVTELAGTHVTRIFSFSTCKQENKMVMTSCTATTICFFIFSFCHCEIDTIPNFPGWIFHPLHMALWLQFQSHISETARVC